MTPSPDLLRAFACTDPHLVAETERAHVWRVAQADGTPACLKQYRAALHAQDEAPGLDLLEAWNGSGAVKVYARHADAVLMEWLPGPDLGDLVRAGDDAQATARLAEVVMQLRTHPDAVPSSLHRLEVRMQPLLHVRFDADASEDIRRTIRAAQDLGQKRLSDGAEHSPLHGDLHHDNIRGSARGYLVIDPKGVLGPLGYEFANAFRNPLGAEDVFGSPQVIARRAQHWGAESGLAPSHLLDWAVVQTGMSATWRHGGCIGASAAQDAALIDTFLSVRSKFG
ncbi:aminoglycoside phosphotransferase family protein [Tateyamaria sp. syn59]|uniref:aminoglycoside phosphotransferase family protein n=1 Tax=Tateyamaria sp. syn59 TaxID=2576942 RepID=UPI001678E42A|nr:aminoglycoside phosphotransferase family protein [Tateyamaria sp. syn59]